MFTSSYTIIPLQEAKSPDKTQERVPRHREASEEAVSGILIHSYLARLADGNVITPAFQSCTVVGCEG